LLVSPQFLISTNTVVRTPTMSYTRAQANAKIEDIKKLHLSADVQALAIAGVESQVHNSKVDRRIIGSLTSSLVRSGAGPHLRTDSNVVADGLKLFDIPKGKLVPLVVQATLQDPETMFGVDSNIAPKFREWLEKYRQTHDPTIRFMELNPDVTAPTSEEAHAGRNELLHAISFVITRVATRFFQGEICRCRPFYDPPMAAGVPEWKIPAKFIIDQGAEHLVLESDIRELYPEWFDETGRKPRTGMKRQR